jgi:hypothetical protein
MEAHLERHRKSSYIHRVASRMLHEWRGRHPCDGGAEHVLAALSIKIFRNKCEKYLNAPYDPANYTKYSYKNTKIPPNTKLILCLFQG